MNIKKLTLPKLLRLKYQEYGRNRVAMRRKKLGIWQCYSWEDYYNQVKLLSLGLISIGLERGENVSIIGENDPEWYWAELATQSAGAVTVGIYPDCTPSEVKYFLEHSGSRFVFAHDQEQVDKIITLQKELPNIEKIIYWDNKGLWFYKNEALMSIEEIMKLGGEYEKTHSGSFEQNIELGQSKDIALILYTSGTTGLPKGAMISHYNYLVSIQDAREIDHLNSEDRHVSFILPAWVAEQMLGVVNQLWVGMEVNFPEEPETIQADLREIGPSLIMYSPRLWELTCSEIQALMNEATGLKRWSYLLAMPIGLKVEKMKANKQKVPLRWKLLYTLADQVFFRQLRDMIGFTNVKFAYTAGAPISPDIINFFRAIGVNLKQVFGSTESGAILTCHRDGDVKPESCGKPVAWAELKISDEGEILARGEAIFAGYYNNPEATAECFDEDGWFHLGDGGYIDDDGHLIVFGRMSEFRELAGGHKFAPENIEIRLRFSPYIKDCLVLGNETRGYVSVIINMDYNNVGLWMEKRAIAYTTYADLSQKNETYELLRKEINKINHYLPEGSRMKKYVVFHKEFDPDEGELTRSRKIRRKFVEKKYEDFINAIYMDASFFTVESTIVYQDGRKALTKTDVRIDYCSR